MKKLCLLISFFILPTLSLSYEKGRLESESITKEEAIFKVEFIPSQSIQNKHKEKQKKSFNKIIPQDILSGWTTIMTDGFEGAFTGIWSVSDGDGSTNGEYFWG